MGTALRRLDGDAKSAAAQVLWISAVVAVAYGGAHAFRSISPLVLAIVIGASLRNLGVIPRADRVLRFAAQHLLRAGIIMLGLRVAFDQVLAIGIRGLVVIVAVMAVTFAGTRWVGTRLGLSSGMSLLVASGFAVCGLSAIAAMRSVAEAEEEEVAFAAALVTICGSLAVVLAPLVAPRFGLSGDLFGFWVGASVHDVAQVIATASTGGPASLQVAVVTKLTRVAMLAPLVVIMGLRRSGVGHGRRHESARPPILPLFLLGFLATAVAASSGLIPARVLLTIRGLEQLTFTAALACIGAGVFVNSLRRISVRALGLGLTAWTLVAGMAYIGTRLAT